MKSSSDSSSNKHKGDKNKKHRKNRKDDSSDPSSSDDSDSSNDSDYITRTQDHHRQTSHQWNHPQTCNKRKRNAIKRKSVIKIGKMTHQTHLRATIQIRPMTVIIYARDTKRRAIEKWSDKIMRTFNYRVADDSVYIKIIRFKGMGGFAPAPDL